MVRSKPGARGHGPASLAGIGRGAVDALGETVAMATATASGKSLCYKIPAFENALESAASRALFLYPTKALAQDQLGKIRAFGLRGVHPATYDGDTPQAIRADVRRRANVVLTNPDMLNVGVLPNHEAWADFLRNLRIVAVGEGPLPPRGFWLPPPGGPPPGARRGPSGGCFSRWRTGGGFLGGGGVCFPPPRRFWTRRRASVAAS